LMGIRQTQAEVPSHWRFVVVRQDRPEQQGLVGEQAWPLDEQVAPGWQVPVVLPWGTWQDRPEQQSEPEVHAPLWGWHAAGASHLPAEQMFEQHCEPAEHVVPLAWQTPPASGVVVPPSVGGVPPSEGGGGV